jgi:site-specific recombinase XerD
MFKPGLEMASIKALLFTSKTLSNGEHPIMLRVTKDRRSKYMSIGHSCTKELWDEKKNLPRKKHPLAKELSIIIDKKINEAKSSLLKLENEKDHFSTEELKSKILRSTKKTTLFQYLDLIVSELNAAGRVSYARSHKDLIRELKKFTKNKDLKFSDVSTFFLRGLEQDFKTRGFKGNTMGIYFRTLRAVYNKAVKDGYARKDNSPFNDYTISHLKNKTQKRAIAKADVKKIQALSFEEESSSFHAKNFFLFSYYCSGINFLDVAKLTTENFTVMGEKVFLNYTRSKTKKNFVVQLTPDAASIYTYYKSNRYSDYVFPFLDSEKHKSPEGIFNRLAKSKRDVNKHLKKIAELAGIEVNLTTYVARHTFATVLKRTGVSTSKISEMLGHENESITQTYLAEFENDELYEASLLL